ncbi:hypothetical protein DYB31_008721, partial [Aphanomyces astaci]
MRAWAMGVGALVAAGVTSSLPLDGWYECAYFTFGRRRRLDASAPPSVLSTYPWTPRGFSKHATVSRQRTAASAAAAGSTPSAQCATITVPLCHDGVCNSVRTIDVFVKRIPAAFGTNSTSVWLVQGGPGASSVASTLRPLGFLVDWYTRLGGQVSVYTMDHRGTGRSELLGCDATQTETAGSVGGSSVTLSELPACLQSMQRRYDYQPVAFSITSAAKDVAAVIAALDDAHVYLYGVSYGTAVVERVMHFSPSAVRGFVLDGVQSEAFPTWADAPTFTNWDRDFSGVAGRFLDLCQDDAYCRPKFAPLGGLRPALLELYDGLDGGSHNCTAFVKSWGASDDAPPSSTLRTLFGSFFPDMTLRLLLPVFIYRLHRCTSNDMDVLTFALDQMYGGGASSSPGDGGDDAPDSAMLYKTIVYSELWQRPTPGLLDLYQDFADSTMSSGIYPQVVEYCIFAGATSSEQNCADLGTMLPDGVDASVNFTYTPDAYFNVTAAIPPHASVVVLSGKLDPQTPHKYALDQFQRMTGTAKRLFPFDYAAHGTIVTTPVATTPNNPTCAVSLIVSYVQNQGDVDKIDTSCLARVLPLVFQWTQGAAKDTFNVTDAFDGVVGQDVPTTPPPSTTSAIPPMHTDEATVSYLTGLVVACAVLGVLSLILVALLRTLHKISRLDAVSSGRLVVADPITAETPLKNTKDVAGKIVLVQRGGCDFLSKTIQVQKAGAVAIIVANTDEENPQLAFVMDAGLTRSGMNAKIPALMAPFATAQHLLDLVGETSGMKLNVSIVLLDATEASAVLDAQERGRQQRAKEADALRMQQEREKKQREATMLLRSRLVKDNQVAKALVDQIIPPVTVQLAPSTTSTLAESDDVSMFAPVLVPAAPPVAPSTAPSAGAMTAEPVKTSSTSSSKLDGVIQSNTTGLLVLDVQYYCAMPHVGKHSNMDRATSSKEYYFDRIKSTMVPNIQSILHILRQRSMEVVYATIESMTKNGRDRSKAHKMAGIHVSKHSFDAKVLESVAPTDYDIVIPRTTNADYILRNLGLACLVLVGVSTLGTLEATVRDALDRGYTALVVEDAVAFDTPEEHAAVMKSAAKMGAHCLQLLVDYGGDVGTVDDRGWSALHYAAACPRGVHAVTWLCEMAPSLTVVDGDDTQERWGVPYYEEEQKTATTMDSQPNSVDETIAHAWVACTTEDGQAYFYNTVTFESVWELPEDASATLQHQDGIASEDGHGDGPGGHGDEQLLLPICMVPTICPLYEMDNPDVHAKEMLRRKKERETRRSSRSKLVVPRSDKPKSFVGNTSHYAVCLWLSLWFALNMTVTIVNKQALTVLNLPVTVLPPQSFIWSSLQSYTQLTCVHMTCNSIGAYVYVHLSCRGGARGRAMPLRPDQAITMFFFSFIFVSNIILGNWSLGLVSVSLNQIMRALVPGTTAVLSTVVLHTTYTMSQILALVPIALGVYVACSRDIASTPMGIAITALAILFASLKSVLSSK